RRPGGARGPRLPRRLRRGVHVGGRSDALVSVAGGAGSAHGHVYPPALRLVRRGNLPRGLRVERRPVAQPRAPPLLEKELAPPLARLVVAVEDGQPRPTIVGYTCCWRVTDEVHLLNVAVHPERRGLGLGRTLLEAVIAEAQTGRARVVFLEVRAGNVVARRLYRRLGFRDLGIRRGYYGPGQDAVVMELRLDGR